MAEEEKNDKAISEQLRIDKHQSRMISDEYSNLDEDQEAAMAEENEHGHQAMRKEQSMMDEEEWLQRMKLVQTIAKTAQIGATIAGQGKLASALGDVGNVAEAGVEGGENAGPGGARKVGSNMAGRAARNIAQRDRTPSSGEGPTTKGMSGDKASALGGAVAGALQGESAANIAKNAASWTILYYAFGALFTVAGTIPALLYLDFHFVMSKLGSKFFSEMDLKQQIILLAANLLALLIILLVALIIYILVDPCVFIDFMSEYSWKAYFASWAICTF